MKLILYIIVFIVSILIGINYLAKIERIVIIRQVDEHHTLIKKEHKEKVHFLSLNLARNYQISGYSVKSQPKLFVNHKIVTIVYRPTQNVSHQLKIMKKSHYIATAFQVINANSKNGRQTIPKNTKEIDRLRVLYSSDGKRWQTLKTNYPNWGIRDPDIIQYKDTWYVVYTAGLMKTKDFRHWKRIDWDYNRFTKWQWLWAPEFFKDKDGHYHIVASASSDGSNFKIYETDFDPVLGNAGNDWSEVTNSNISGNSIDPHVFIWNDRYKLLTKNENSKQLNLADSDQYNTNFSNNLINIPNLGHLMVEAPESEPLNDFNTSVVGMRVYFDVYDMNGYYYGIHYTDSNASLDGWSKSKAIKADFVVRHFGIWNNFIKK